MTRTNRRLRVLTAAGLSAAALASVAACGGGSKPAAAGPTPSSSSTSPAAAGQTPPGTTGLIAAVSPGSLEVQDQTTGQTTVTYSSATAFTEQKSVTATAVTAGTCVTAIAVSPGSTPSAPPTTHAAGTPTSITATSVAITQPVNGSCTATGTALGRRGARASGAPSSFPTASRTAGGFGGFGGFGGIGGVVTGKVTSMSGSTITVAATDRQTGQTVDDTVTVTGSTHYSETIRTTATAAQVGLCATAIGTANSTGAVAATRIAISPAVNGSCTAGFGRRVSGTATTGGIGG